VCCHVSLCVPVCVCMCMCVCVCVEALHKTDCITVRECFSSTNEGVGLVSDIDS